MKAELSVKCEKVISASTCIYDYKGVRVRVTSDPQSTARYYGSVQALPPGSEAAQRTVSFTARAPCLLFINDGKASVMINMEDQRVYTIRETTTAATSCRKRP